jgi:UDP-glucose 6-dehydrogenase
MLMDVDQEKLVLLQQGQLPIYESGLDALMSEPVSKEFLHFTSDPAAALSFSDLILIAAGTPPREDGPADRRQVLDVAAGIGSDPRIDYHFIYAGCGYGGSGLPKAVRALPRSAQDHACPMPLLSAVEAPNVRQY